MNMTTLQGAPCWRVTILFIALLGAQAHAIAAESAAKPTEPQAYPDLLDGTMGVVGDLVDDDAPRTSAFRRPTMLEPWFEWKANLRREHGLAIGGSWGVLWQNYSDSLINQTNAVGSKFTRQQAFAAVKPGGVIMHIGLQDWASEVDMRKLTLAEITLLGTYTYTTADLRATVDALHRGVFGDLSWVEVRRLDEGPQAFVDLDRGHSASAKIVLQP